MKIQTNISLKSFNTFGIDVKASHFVEVHSVKDAVDLIQHEIFHFQHYFVLGGGSNILFTKDYSGLIIHPSLKGIQIVKEDKEHIWIKASAGEVWNDFVEFCIERNYVGVENLYGIPGSVGASPVQNIGAYGVEAKDVIESVDAIHLQTGEKRTFSHQECHFEYRSSIFKKELSNQYLILSVTYKLNKNQHFNIEYGSIANQLKEEIENNTLTSQKIACAVMEIRNSKLPQTHIIGSAGSFFKNPIISLQKFKALKEKYPDIPHYLLNEKVKIPAGWLIEQCNWKGYRKGDLGVYKQQALVLVNYGNASGADVLKLSQAIQQDVKNTFGIELFPEVISM